MSDEAINFESLWQTVLAMPSHRFPGSVHGPDHWRRVERNGLILAQESGANITVVRLFALFHDSCRENENHDPNHGRRGAALARALRGKAFELSDEWMAKLEYACIWHTDLHHHEDATIATCWDADRLDLGRVGITPHPKYLNTALAKEMARHGSNAPWLSSDDH